MLLTFMLLWWHIPALIGVVGVLLAPQGPGGFFLALILWGTAIAMCAGHYLNF